MKDDPELPARPGRSKAVTVGGLFAPAPEQWGLRGDPFLWKDMARVFRDVPLPDSEAALRGMLEAAFLALTAHGIDAKEAFFVERYAHGGMSSGHVDPEFWRERGIPIILERLASRVRKFGSRKSKSGSESVFPDKFPAPKNRL